MHTDDGKREKVYAGEGDKNYDGVTFFCSENRGEEGWEGEKRCDSEPKLLGGKFMVLCNISKEYLGSFKIHEAYQFLINALWVGAIHKGYRISSS